MKHIRYSPLLDQYSKPDPILREIKEVVTRGDYTLGAEVLEFEKLFAKSSNRVHAIGVGSGTDALKIPLRAAGIGYGDEVITTANSFWAVVGAITEVGAYPVLIDVGSDMQMDPDLLEQAITPKTKAIVPVHLAGNVSKMKPIMDVAKSTGLHVFEDGCQSQGAIRDGKQVGSWGDATAFSMHPLKILNIWGDGGVVVTDNTELDDRIRVLRNHGLRNRDSMECFGYNSRLDTVQAVVGKYILGSLEWILNKRRENAKTYINGLTGINEVSFQDIDENVSSSYLYFVIFVKDREKLKAFCEKNGVEVKVHYPTPLYRQKALQDIGYKDVQFKNADVQSERGLSLPVDQHLIEEDIKYVTSVIKEFYGGKT